MWNRNINRALRVSEEIQKKISFIFQNKIDDPRIGMVTVSSVCLSKDLKFAKVFITFLNKNSLEEVQIAILALQRATSFIRFILAKTVYLRKVPFLLFEYDSSLVEGLKLYNLILKDL